MNEFKTLTEERPKWRSGKMSDKTPTPVCTFQTTITKTTRK